MEVEARSDFEGVQYCLRLQRDAAEEPQESVTLPGVDERQEAKRILRTAELYTVTWSGAAAKAGGATP